MVKLLIALPYHMTREIQMNYTWTTGTEQAV